MLSPLAAAYTPRGSRTHHDQDPPELKKTHHDAKILEHPHNNIVARAEALWDRDIVPRGLLPVALLRGGRAYLFLAVAGIERDSGAGDLVGTDGLGVIDDEPCREGLTAVDPFEHRQKAVDRLVIHAVAVRHD